MKKIMFTAIAIVAMAMASFAANTNATLFTNDGGNATAIEKTGGPSKEYLDIKKIMDEYEENVNKATTCEELDDAQIMFFLKLLGLVDDEYSESDSMTEKEEQQINAQMERIDKKVSSLQEQWQCPTEEEGGDEEEPAENLIPTSTEEWDKLLDSYDALANKMNGMKSLDFSDEGNMSKLMEFLVEAEPIITRIDQADTEHMTEKQSARLEAISQRFLDAAKAMGLISDDE